jgi:hypothetical protein
VAFSLLGYFVSMIIVFSAAVGAMIGLFNFSTSEGVRHYSRPAFERNFTATNREPRLFMSVPNTKDGSPAKNIETNSTEVAAEKSDAKKSKSHKAKALARQRNNYERPSYGNPLGYAEAYRNGPQRLFSNW